MDGATIGVTIGSTLLGSFLGAVIALWIQRRDFRARATELERQTGLARDERLEAARLREREQAAENTARKLAWRRDIVAKALDVVDTSMTIAHKPASSDKVELAAAQIDSLQMLFDVDPEPGGIHVGRWFQRLASNLFELQPTDQAGVAATLRSYLVQWATDKKTSASFEAM